MAEQQPVAGAQAPGAGSSSGSASSSGRHEAPTCRPPAAHSSPPPTTAPRALLRACVRGFQDPGLEARYAAHKARNTSSASVLSGAVFLTLVVFRLWRAGLEVSTKLPTCIPCGIYLVLPLLKIILCPSLLGKLHSSGSSSGSTSAPGHRLWRQHITPLEIATIVHHWGMAACIFGATVMGAWPLPPLHTSITQQRARGALWCAVLQGGRVLYIAFGERVRACVREVVVYMVVCVCMCGCGILCVCVIVLLV